MGDLLPGRGMHRDRLRPDRQRPEETEVYHILYLSGAQALAGSARHVELVKTSSRNCRSSPR